MGSVPIFHDPYGSNSQSPAQIDKLIGSAYEVVREVAENLEYIKHVSAHLVQIYRVYQSVDGIDTLYENIEGLELLLAHLDEIILVATNMNDVNEVAINMDIVESLSENMFQLLAIHENLDAIIAAGGVVIVAEEPPGSVLQGKLWWDSNSGNLFTYYFDGTSGQWVQVNIANPVYDWSEITNKPTTFPPGGHTHQEYVKDTGDVMTGPLTIAPPSTMNAALVLKSLGVTSNVIVGQTANTDGTSSDRWYLFLGDNKAEPGGPEDAVGTDFQIRRHSNKGAVIDSPITIDRSTGIPNFRNGLTAPTPGVNINNTTVATTAYVTRAVVGIDEILGTTFKVYGVPVIHIPPATNIAKTSMAIGNGLTKSVSNAGNEGRYNLAVGLNSLATLTTGVSNTTVGVNTGMLLTTGANNTALGVNALYSVTAGNGNTAVGLAAIFGDPDAVGDPSTVGDWSYNTALGYAAIYEIASGATYNVGIGVYSLANPGVSKGISGSYNNAIGGAAIHNIENASYNQALGYAALADIITGSSNIGIGHNTGRGITTGTGNVIIGHGIVGLSAALTNTMILGTGNGSRLLVGSPAGVAILGSNTNDFAVAGYVGEFKEINVAPAAAIALTANVAKTITQLTLTPGDWDVGGWIGFTTISSTNVVRIASSVSLTSNVVDTTLPGVSQADFFGMAGILPGAGTPFRGPVGSRKVSIAATSVVYLTVQATFSLGALSAWGKIWARRAR